MAHISVIITAVFMSLGYVMAEMTVATTVMNLTVQVGFFIPPQTPTVKTIQLGKIKRRLHCMKQENFMAANFCESRISDIFS
jgi:hypothetical protein